MAPGPGKPAKENQPRGLPLASQPSEVLARAQEDEREVLKAIFMDDFEEAEATGAWSVCSCIHDIILPFFVVLFSRNTLALDDSPQHVHPGALTSN